MTWLSRLWTGRSMGARQRVSEGTSGGSMSTGSRTAKLPRAAHRTSASRRSGGSAATAGDASAVVPVSIPHGHGPVNHRRHHLVSGAAEPLAVEFSAQRLDFLAELMADEAKVLVDASRETLALAVFELAAEIFDLADQVRQP